MSRTEREPYFQMVRGMCICAVILIHCSIDYNNNTELFSLIIVRQVVDFAVGIFIFLAGYFAKPQKMREYWKQLKKLIIPFLLWGLFYSLASGNRNLIKILWLVISGTSSAQMYFIIVLLELTILTPLLWKAIGSFAWSKTIYVVTPIYLLIFLWVQYSFQFSSFWKGRDFAAWLLFYYVSLKIKRNGWKKKSNFELMILFLIALVLSILEGMQVIKHTGVLALAVTQLKLSTMLYTLSVICLVMNNRNALESAMRKGIITRILIRIGNASYGIFYAHVFVLRCVTWALSQFGYLGSLNLLLIQAMQFFLTVIITLAVVEITRKFDKDNKICFLIGF